jgi:uncharacterized protein YaiE (UPF0345 family)
MKKVVAAFLLLFSLNAKASGIIFSSIINSPCADFCGGSFNMQFTSGLAPYSIGLVSHCDTMFVTASTNSCTVSGICGCNSTYTVMVSDSWNSVIATGTVNVTAPPPFSIHFTNVQPSCSSCTGSMCVNVSGGTPPYMYNWTPSGATSSCLTTAAPGSYTVSVMDVNGCSHPAYDSLHFSSGINKNEMSNEWNIYPNPANAALFFELPAGTLISQCRIEIYDLTGRKVKSLTAISNPVAIDDLSEGFYEIKVSSDKSVFHKKILVGK